MKKLRVFGILGVLVLMASLVYGWGEYRGGESRSAFNAADGTDAKYLKLKWTAQVSPEGVNLSSPVLDDNYIYTAASDGSVKKINRATGAVVISFAADSAVSGIGLNLMPVIIDYTVITAGGLGVNHVFSLKYRGM